MFPIQAIAANLEVEVFFNGVPAKNIRVCAGSIQQRGLYKISQTDDNGKVIFKKLPEGRIVITANKPKV